MKKLVVVTLITFFSIFFFVSSSFGEQQPRYGGHLRIITGGGSTPKNIGYSAKQSFGDTILAKIWSDRILNVLPTGDFTSSIAESYEISPDLKTIIFHLQKGVVFQDGTPCNAEAVVWSFQQNKDAGRLAGGKRIDRFEAVDDYTVKVTLNAPNNQVIYDLARVYMYSPTAFNKMGEEWAISNSVSTAAFQVIDFKRDVVVKMKKSKDYWRPGFPYLDSIDLITVKGLATCQVMMQAGQADIWMNSSPQEAAELKAQGLSIITTPTTYINIYPDSTDPTSPFAKKKVREAIEYAIDRKAMAEALGFGFMVPVDQPTHKGTFGYNPDYPVRAYNPEKAKKLIAEAGYPNGIKTTLLVGHGSQDSAAIIQNYLAEVGIEVKIDVAEVGRFWGSINKGWKGLLQGPSAVNPEYCVAWLHHFGPEPIMKFASMAKSKDYIDLCNKLVVAPDKDSMRKLTMEMVTQAGLDCMYIPLTLNLGTAVHAPNFHTSFFSDLDWTYWSIWDDWWEKK